MIGFGTLQLTKLGRRLTPGHLARLLLLIVLGVAGYAAFQLGPAWFGLLSGRRDGGMRKEAATCSSMGS